MINDQVLFNFIIFALTFHDLINHDKSFNINLYYTHLFYQQIHKHTERFLYLQYIDPKTFIFLAFRWNQRSVVHKPKLRLLQNTAEDQLRRIGGYVTCQQDAFKVGRPTSDGTCVYVGLREADGKEVAVKCMLTDNCEHLAENESKIFGMLKMEKSPHVVRYLDYQKGNPFVFIILELCEFSLKEYVIKAREFPDQTPFNPQKIIKEILTGLDILHKQGVGNEKKILHRDLKPDNVLVDVAWSIRLADFGVSKTIGEGRVILF